MNGLITSSLAELETVIERGLTTFVNVGMALLEIRDQRLYRDAGYERFEDYCRERWGWSSRHVNRQIEAAQVASIVGPMGPTPTNQSAEAIRTIGVDHGIQTESQARELAPLVKQDPEAARELWSDLREKHGDDITAAHIRQAVGERLGRRESPESPASQMGPIGPTNDTSWPQHVAALEAHPQLDEQPKTVAIEYARAVKEFPELSPEQSPGLPPEKVVSMASVLRRIPEGPERDSARRGAATWHKSYGLPSVQERVANAPSILAHKAIDHLQLARKIIEKAGGPEAIVSDLEGDPTAQMAIAVFSDEIAVSMAVLTEWQQALDRIGKLRRVK